MSRDLTPAEMAAVIAADRERVRAEIAAGLARLGKRPAPTKPPVDLDAVRATIDTKETP